ncbi:MAG: PepSY-associated TM helix domain-containing protein [Chromatiales bacterium]|nr:PepSY-associated TM helix domain-containing protein [Chromatiales bacterium]
MSDSCPAKRFSLGTLRQWHWVSAAICLIGMLLFAVTGITLNHAEQIEADPEVITLTLVLPEPLLAMLQEQGSKHEAPLPNAVREWLWREHKLGIPAHAAQWSAEEIYLTLPRPGGDGWLSVDTATGDITYEVTDQGWISYMNDLHKGRHTGPMWSWFIDVFAVLCVIFCLTGLLLLRRHARARSMTWPMVGLGLLLPLFLIILFMQ